MRKKAGKSKLTTQVDWAVEVRKQKPLLNALSEEQRQALLAEGLTAIRGARKPNARRHHPRLWGDLGA
jgi:hypothetical protein